MEQWYSTNIRHTITRCVFVFILLSLIYHYVSHTLLHQLQAPVFQFAFIDPMYILFSISGLSSFIVQHFWLALFVDSCMFIGALLIILFPQKRFLIILFSVLYFIYFVIYNLYGMHHTHILVGILLAPLPFWASNNTTFTYLWSALRYYTLCIYSLAFFWKVFRHSLFSPDQPMAVLKDNLTPYIYFHPDTTQTALYQFFMQHPGLLYIFYLFAVAMEGFFLVGFFTRRFDHALITAGILIHIGILFFADAFFIEIFILYFSLIKFPMSAKETHSPQAVEYTI